MALRDIVRMAKQAASVSPEEDMRARAGLGAQAAMFQRMAQRHARKNRGGPGQGLYDSSRKRQGMSFQDFLKLMKSRPATKTGPGKFRFNKPIRLNFPTAECMTAGHPTTTTG